MTPAVVRNCHRKITYRTLAAAHFAVQVLECRFGGTPVQPYRCPNCGKFHLGRSDARHIAMAWAQILRQHAAADALLSQPVVEADECEVMA